MSTFLSMKTEAYSLIIQGKTGEEYKKLLAGLSKTEREEIEEYRKKFNATKLSEKAAENFLNIFKI